MDGARQGFVAGSLDGRQVVVAGRFDPPGDPSLRLVQVDRISGDAVTLLALDLGPVEPGRYRGQVQSGAGRVFPVTIPDGVSYPGRPMVATVTAGEPGLKVRVLDARAALVSESLGGGSVHRAAWLGQPGEEYLVSVGPGEGYLPGSTVGFELRVAEGALASIGSYSGAWDVDRLAVRGDVAVVTGPTGVQTVSLADPVNPWRVARKHVPGPVQGLVLAQEKACLARTFRRRGLRCLDVSDPAHLAWGGPATVTLGMARGIASLGELGYVAEGVFGVGIYHLTPPGHPGRPTALGRIQMPGLAIHVAVHSTRLYVSLVGGAVEIFDLATPAYPAYLGTIQAGGPVVGLRVHGYTAHLHLLEPGPGRLVSCLLGLRCHRGETVEVFDVGDPAAPVQIGDYNAQYSIPWAFVTTYGTRMLVPGGRGFEVHEITALEAP